MLYIIVYFGMAQRRPKDRDWQVATGSMAYSQSLVGHVPASRVSDAEKLHFRSHSDRQHGQQRVSLHSADRSILCDILVAKKAKKAGSNMCASSRNGMHLPLVIGLS